MNYENIDEQLILQSLLRLSILLINSNNGQKVATKDAWKFDAQMLAFKLFRHISSLHILYKGMRIKTSEDANIEFIDHSSMLVITRSAFETYLVFHFIYGNHPEETLKYRHLIWKYSGLQDRQKLKSITAESQQKQDREFEKILELAMHIKANPHFQNNLTPKQQKQLLGGDWRVGSSWGLLAEEAGFHPAYFQNIYGYLCGYSHASWASALQIRDAKEYSNQFELARSVYFVGIVIMAHFCCAYSEFFPAAKKVLSDYEYLHKIARLWRLIKEDMKFYDR